MIPAAYTPAEWELHLDDAHGCIAPPLRNFIMLNADQPECWPALPLDSWRDTYATLHMWSQMVGKVRLALTPLVNHWWNVPLYVSARGLATSRIPYDKIVFQLDFDFVD